MVQRVAGPPFTAPLSRNRKQLWPKGYRLLMNGMSYYRKRMGGKCFPIDLYGSGPDGPSIARVAKRRNLPVTMCGYGDHASLREYRVFVNPSVTEV